MNFTYQGKLIQNAETKEVWLRSSWSQWVVFSPTWELLSTHLSANTNKDAFVEAALEWGRAEEARLHKENASKLLGKAVYVRFGKIPPSGVSHNYRDDVDEAGVSCYSARLVKGKVLIDCPDPAFVMFNSDRPLYLITGELVEVTGSDGEPLLENCKLGKKIEAWELI